MAYERLADVLKFDLLPVMLFVGGDAVDAFDAAVAADVPCMILDLEDGVPPARKARARDLTAAWVKSHGQDHNLHVRVNGLELPDSYADLEAVTCPTLSGIVIPKLEDPVQVQIVDWALTALEARHGMRPGAVELTGTIETVAGVNAVKEIAKAAPRLKRLVFGLGDFSVDAGLPWPPSPGPTPGIINWSKVEVAMASFAAGIEPPHDGVYADLADEPGLRRDAEFVRSLGYWGKHALGLAQVEPILDVYRATDTELDQARRILRAASEGGEESDAGEIHPSFVTTDTVRRARRLLAQARSLSADGDEASASGTTTAASDDRE